MHARSVLQALWPLTTQTKPAPVTNKDQMLWMQVHSTQAGRSDTTAWPSLEAKKWRGLTALTWFPASVLSWCRMRNSIALRSPSSCRKCASSLLSACSFVSRAAMLSSCKLWPPVTSHQSQAHAGSAECVALWSAVTVGHTISCECCCQCVLARPLSEIAINRCVCGALL